MPINQGYRDEMLKRKRKEYIDIVQKYFGDFEYESVNELLTNDKLKNSGSHTI